MIENKYLITVVIPLYNHEAHVQETVNSVLMQTYANFELIIIDDGSIDNSGAIVKRIQKSDFRVHYYYQENKGAHAAINRGIEQARGEFIAILNSDDVFHEDRLQKCLDWLTSHDCDVVFTHVNLIDESNNLLHYKRGSDDNWIRKDEKTSFKGECDFLIDLMAGNYLVSTSNLFCRKSVFDKVGLFKSYRYAHDYDMFLRMGLEYRGKIQIIPELLLNYRFHSTNTISEAPLRNVIENNLILANLVLKYPIEKILGVEFLDDETILRLYNSIQTLDSDRLMMTILMIGRGRDDDYFESFSASHPKFVEAFIESEEEKIAKRETNNDLCTTPKVTVVVPLYNQGKYLQECIGSILAQTFSDYEIIIVNDGSTDPFTLNLLETYRPRKTKILHKANGHLSSARNYGITRSSSPYILTLDSDDKFEPTFLEKAVSFLDTNPEYGVCTCLQQNFGESEELLDPGGGGIHDFLVDNHCLGNSLFRRDCWVQAGGFDEAMTDGYEDWNFWVAVTKNGWKVHVIKEGLFLYRIKKDSMSKESEKIRPDLVRRIVENHIEIYRENVAAVIHGKEKEIFRLKKRIKALQNGKD